MKGRGNILIEAGVVNATNPGFARLDEAEAEASMGDYGRNDNPTLTLGVPGAYRIEFEFVTPDEARKLAERLLALARSAEDKSGNRGPEYRAKLARDEALAEMRDLVTRVEKAMGVESPTDGLPVFPAKIAAKV